MRNLDDRIFSENNTISKRQAFRMMTLLMMAAGTLVVPQLLASYAGGLGTVCIIFANMIGYALMSLAGRRASKNKSPQKAVKSDFADKITLIFLVWLVVSGYCAIRLFINVIAETLLRERSDILILSILLILVIYGISHGIESMARVSEIIFLFLLIPLALMLINALSESFGEGVIYVFGEIAAASPVSYPVILRLIKGTLASLVGVAPAIFVSGIARYTKENKIAFEAGKTAIVVSGIFNLTLYLVLLGIFGLPYLATMEYPVVTLMSTVQSSMGFFKRADAFMTGILFFLLYIYVSAAVYFAWNIVRTWVRDGK